MAHRIYYLRDGINQHHKDDGTLTRGNPVVCIVSEFNRETKQVKYNFSALYPGNNQNKKGDAFDKELGKNIAIGRLNKKPIVVEMKEEVKRGFEINRIIISDLAERFKDREHSRIKDAAHLWLDKAKVSKEPALDRAE